MFPGISMSEMFLILAIALMVIGPKKLPDIAKALGRALGEFKKATREFKETIEINTDLQDVKKAFDDINPDFRSSMSSQEETESRTEPDRNMASEEEKVQDAAADPPPEEGSDKNGSGCGRKKQSNRCCWDFRKL